MTTFPRIDDGTLVLYRLFDVADDIDLAASERHLAGTAHRLRLSGERPGYLSLPDPPLTVALAPREIDLATGKLFRAEMSARVFAHGVVSVRFEIALPPGAEAALLASLVRGAADHPALERIARDEAEALAARLAPALSAPHSSPVFETYTVIFARRLSGPAESAEGPDLARVLLGEPPEVALSPKAVEDVTRHRFSYTTSDLCVIDWDAAFVVEPSGDRSVLDVLELATAQLLEFRYYDSLFETELLHVTALLGQPRTSLAWLFVGRYTRVTRRVQHLVVESVELVERVENAVRVVGDIYLARLYRSAVDRFRIPMWEAGVLRRQQAAAQVAELLRSEANSALAHVLEATIVGLIVLEILLAL